MFTLHVDTERWRSHLTSFAAARPNLVPVVKGNGYGFGVARLAGEAQRLGVAAVAVGTAAEVPEVLDAFGPGGRPDVLVLTPFLPGVTAQVPGAIATVVDADGLAALPEGARAVVELRTSMRRHGIAPDDALELTRVRQALDGDRVQLAGFALHLPIAAPPGRDKVAEVDAWVRRLRAAHLPVSTLWLSHLTPAELARLAAGHPDLTLRPRVGTDLWLGDRRAFEVRGTVLDVERLSGGETVGYRQYPTRAGTLVVVGGGTGHGVGLEAPRPVERSAAGVLRSAKLLAAAGLAATGRTRSPFRWHGHRCWFAEPPHMQVSLVLLPQRVEPPAVGDELPCDVRMTTSHFDAVVG